jgi:hypothetical protein
MVTLGKMGAFVLERIASRAASLYANALLADDAQ